MDPETPIVLAVYADRHAAVADYRAARDAKTAGEYDHLAITVLTKRTSER